jgi:hypothetical protein
MQISSNLHKNFVNFVGFYLFNVIKLIMKKITAVFVVLAALLMWQCSRTADTVSLKSAVDDGVAKINTAMSVITGTKGYELMTITDLTKSEESFNDSINLDMIAGVYDFVPDTFFCHRFYKPFWRFEKTAESEMLVMNLPQRLVFHPRYLFNPNPPDTVAENDFTITASDYHCYYSFWHNYDYRLTAGFTLKDEDIGSLDVMYSGETFADKSYSSEYKFTEDYSVSVSYERGDTSVSSFELKKGDEILLAEERSFIWKGFHQSERMYTLTIGDVQIVRGSEIDSIQVYLDGVLQQTAGARITDENEGDGSVCHRRDILLTFDDGTTEKLSELIGPALDTLGTLTGTMREMYFAKRIVDHLAFSLYYQRH